MQLNKNSVYYCKSCKANSNVIDEKHGQYVCTLCGTVLPVNVVDETSEYRQFAVEHGVKDRSRTSYSGDGDDLGTTIQIGSSKRNKMLTEAHRKISVDPKTAQLKKATRRIKTVSENLDLSKKIYEDACVIYREALDAGIIKSQRRGAVDAACIYFSCRNNQQSRNVDEIVAEGGEDDLVVKDVENVIKNFESKLKSITARTISPAELAQRLCTRLGYQPYISKAALEIGRRIEDLGMFSGVNPNAVAGAITLFIMGGLLPEHQRSKSEIALFCGCGEGTIEKHFRNIEGIKSVIIKGQKQYESMVNIERNVKK